MRSVLWVVVAIVTLGAAAVLDRLPNIFDLIFMGGALPAAFLAGRMSTRIVPLNFIKDYINVD